jgi:hypothetical protein
MKVRNNMFENYKKFNLLLSPLYIILGLTLVLGVLFTYEEEMYVIHMFYVILQLWAIITIPNVFYFIWNRKEQGNGKAFLQYFFLMPVPFIVLAAIMRVVMAILI